MSNRRIVFTVSISLLVIVVLAAGGYALYRLGYVRGASGTMPGVMMHEFQGRLEGFRGTPFREFAEPGQLRGWMPMAGFPHLNNRFSSSFGGVSTLLLLIGVIALVVIAVNGWVARTNQDPARDPVVSNEEPKRKSRTRKE